MWNIGFLAIGLLSAYAYFECLRENDYSWYRKFFIIVAFIFFTATLITTD